MFFSYFYYFVNWNFLILSFIEVVFGTLLFLCFFGLAFYMFFYSFVKFYCRLFQYFNKNIYF